jgi:hypothetical protein
MWSSETSACSISYTPSDANRKMLLDPVAAADIANNADTADIANNADTADIHTLTVRNVCCPVTMQQRQF